MKLSEKELKDQLTEIVNDILAEAHLKKVIFCFRMQHKRSRWRTYWKKFQCGSWSMDHPYVKRVVGS